jgi:integrase
MPTLAEWLTMWAEERSGNLRIKTMRTNISLINCHVIPTLGSYRLNQLSVSAIESLYRDLLERKNLSPNSVQRIHAALTVPLQGALREGIISTNPMAHVVKPRAPKPKMSPLTVQHRDLVWAAIRNLEASEQLRWTLALKYGLRQSEALGLQREDYDDYSQVLACQRHDTKSQGGAVLVPSACS